MLVESASSERGFDERVSEPLPPSDDRVPPSDRSAPAREPSNPEVPKQAVEGAAVRPAPAPEPVRVSPATKTAKRGWVRPILFALLPVALVAGGYQYVTGGQLMSTDNAYVQAQMIGLSTDVSGTVVSVEVHNNETVTKGQVMFRLRPDAFQVALDGATAQLGTVRNQVLTLQATYKQSLAQIEQAKADLPFYQTGFDRQKNLVASAAASKASFDQAEHDLTAARQRLVVAQAQAQSMLAQLGGDADQRVEDNPFYLQSKSLVDNAKRDLNDTVVRAPFAGTVTNVDALQVGQYLPASQQAFMLVSSDNVWIEASPKETELTWVKPGQDATVSVDTYPGVTWTAKVQSINPASGASFSLLPAQNTSGNWVKVVQRIPMRLQIDPAPGKPPLRVGMSVVVDVETGHARGLPEALKPLAAELTPYWIRARQWASQTLAHHG